MSKQALVPIALIIGTLFIVGFLVGGIGSKMFGLPQLLHAPEVHLPPQPVFPAESRNYHLGLIERGNGGHGEVDDHGEATDGEDGEVHGKPLAITEFAITNTLLSAWLTSLVMIALFVAAAAPQRMVPRRLQSVVEMLFEAFLNFSASIVGQQMARRVFPVTGTIFFFVMFNAWIAILLVPLYQAVGFEVDGEIKAHLLRPAGTDLNMPLALALVSFVLVEYWGLKALGLGYLGKFFNFGNLFRGKFLQGFIDIFVGILELISEFVRIVSFTFRLFGNMTAGEILVLMFTFLVPFVATQIVFGLELLVGLIQAVIFAGLTLVFLALATTAHGGHEEGHAEHPVGATGEHQLIGERR